jgi:Asp-tRNA(Asn)/Glu-tRNA(Gln) amidotransferase C subunit
MEIDKGYLRDIMGLVMVDEDPRNYIDDIGKIIKLFDELDEFDMEIRDLSPLYHP